MAKQFINGKGITLIAMTSQGDPTIPGSVRVMISLNFSLDKIEQLAQDDINLLAHHLGEAVRDMVLEEALAHLRERKDVAWTY